MYNGNYGGYGISAADVAAVTRNNDNGFGGDGWWAWIIMFALFGGWGNGFGGWGGGNQQFTQADMARGFDTQNILGSLRGIEQGICSLGYDQLGQFNAVNTNVLQTGFGLQNAMNQGFNALQAKQSECCCENRAAIAQVRYDMATDTCTVTTAIDRLGDRIEGRLTTMEMNALRDQNAELRQRLNDCSRDTALQGTASYIIDAIRPTPRPSWNVQNPWANCGCGTSWNSGCGSCM